MQVGAYADGPAVGMHLKGNRTGLSVHTSHNCLTTRYPIGNQHLGTATGGEHRGNLTRRDWIVKLSGKPRADRH